MEALWLFRFIFQHNSLGVYLVLWNLIPCCSVFLVHSFILSFHFFETIMAYSNLFLLTILLQSPSFGFQICLVGFLIWLKNWHLTILRRISMILNLVLMILILYLLGHYSYIAFLLISIKLFVSVFQLHYLYNHN